MGVERDAIESSTKVTEHDRPRVIEDDAWSGAEADAEDVNAAVAKADRTHKSGVEKRPGGERYVDSSANGVG